MGNPLMSMLGNNMAGMTGGNNPMQMMQEFQKFRQMFSPNANPQQILNTMLNSGKISQSQVDQAVNMAKQMWFIK